MTSRPPITQEQIVREEESEIEETFPNLNMPDDRDWGYGYFNPDTGHEWARQHPVQSGEVPDATEVQRMTLGGFKRRYPETPHA